MHLASGSHQHPNKPNVGSTVASSTPPSMPTPPKSTAPISAAPKPPRQKWSKRKKIIVISASIAAGLILIGGGVALAWQLSSKPAKTITPKHSATPTPSPTPSPTPVKKASPITGVMIDPADAAKPIFSAIIENHLDARPQSGLSQAGVVYEANAEGGITRFQAFFLDNLPTKIGPVRSLRTYFVDWGLEFNSPVAHAGGNADAMDLIAPLSLKSLNGLNIGAPYFYRTTDKYAPHNFYTGSDLIRQLLDARGWNGPATFTPSPRQADTPTATPAHPNIHINFSYNGYQVDYAYDATANDYARSLAGAPHIDANTGQQIHVKNVVVEYMPTSYGFTRISEDTVIMQTVGQGKAVVFRDGQAIEGTWKKDSHTARTQLLDAAGKDIPLDAGNTWYSIVPVGNTVSY